MWVLHVSCGTDRKLHICQRKWSQQVTHGRENSFHGYISSRFIVSLRLCDDLTELPFLVVLCDPLVWPNEGMYPDCSVLTLTPIVHFNAEAYCYGAFSKRWTEQSQQFLNFLKWQHCEVWSNGIRGFFFFPQRNVCLNNLIVLGIPEHSLSMLSIPLPNNRTHSWGIKVISIRITTMSEECRPAGERRAGLCDW